MKPQLGSEERVYPDVEALSQGAAEESVRAITLAASKGRCTITLAGGRTPARMYSLWAEKYRDAIPWSEIHLFWGDERFVPHTDSRSNYRMVREALLDRVPLPAANIHPIETDFAKPEDAAEAYEKKLREFFSNELPAFDLVLLGMGGEGHTASLFPDSPALEEKERWVVAVRAPIEPPVRLSLTLPVLNRARNVLFLAAGAEKKEVLQAIRNDPEGAARRYPAAMVRPAGHVCWFLDQAAVG
jgi:6-phosphogluconolactonase